MLLSEMIQFIAVVPAHFSLDKWILLRYFDSEVTLDFVDKKEIQN